MFLYYIFGASTRAQVRLARRHAPHMPHRWAQSSVWRCGADANYIINHINHNTITKVTKTKPLYKAQKPRAIAGLTRHTEKQGEVLQQLT